MAWRTFERSAVFACVAILLFGGGCRRKTSPQRVLLVSIDTLRADRLGCYGYEAARTPFLDRMAAEGVLFSQARTPVPLTLPSHASILTGTIPPHHGVRNNGEYFLGEEAVTIAERLRENSYDTAAFVGSTVMDRRYGLSQGFEEYRDQMKANPMGTRFMDELRAEDVLDNALQWLRGKERTTPCFAFIHLFDPHQPYSPPQGFAASDHPSDLYDGEIAYVDRCLSRFFERLEEASMTDAMLLVVLSDHGEGLGEHGEDTHGVFLYDSTVRVPLLFWKGPGAKLSVPFEKGTATQGVSLTDVAPSLLDLLGLEELKGADGRSFAESLAGEKTDDSKGFYMETLLPELDYGWAPLKGWCRGEYKYVDAPREELYDIRSDPGERQNLLLEQPDLAIPFKKALSQATEHDRANTRFMSSDERTRLESLGYLSGSSDPTPGEKADPKDRVHLLKRVTLVSALVDRGRYEEAISEARAILEEDPSLLHALRLLGKSLAFAGLHLEAAAAYEEALSLAPRHTETHNNLGCVYLALNDLDRASKHFAAALSIDPNHPEARANLILISKERGKS